MRYEMAAFSRGGWGDAITRYMKLGVGDVSICQGSRVLQVATFCGREQ